MRGTVENEKEWNRIVGRARADVFQDFGYVMALSTLTGASGSDFGGEPFLFAYGNSDNYVAYPFLKRDLGRLQFASQLRGVLPAYDVTSPYGYSGPMEFTTDRSVRTLLWKKFLNEFHAYCLEQGIVSEFARLNPFTQNHLPLSETSEDVKRVSKVVYVDLERGREVQWEDIGKPSRNIIRKARREGIEITESSSPSDLSSFIKLYNETMTRRGASESYYFPSKFYEELFLRLGSDAKLFLAKGRDGALGGAVFLSSGQTLHYFLSASKRTVTSAGASNLLLLEAINWARSKGFAVMNLGGGYTEGDGLLRFKQSFSRLTAPFYVYCKVHDADRYIRLCRARDDAEMSGMVASRSSDFFPRYRR